MSWSIKLLLRQKPLQGAEQEKAIERELMTRRVLFSLRIEFSEFPGADPRGGPLFVFPLADSVIALYPRSGYWRTVSGFEQRGNSLSELLSAFKIEQETRIDLGFDSNGEPYIRFGKNWRSKLELSSRDILDLKTFRAGVHIGELALRQARSRLYERFDQILRQNGLLPREVKAEGGVWPAITEADLPKGVK
jgi:hypothetical protein